jgi:hypothetical protein
MHPTHPTSERQTKVPGSARRYVRRPIESHHRLTHRETSSASRP